MTDDAPEFRLICACFCQEIQSEPEIMIRGFPTDGVTPTEMPGILAVPLILCAAADPPDSKPKVFEIAPIDPEGKRLGIVKVTVQSTNTGLFYVAGPFSVVMTVPGRYLYVVSVDGQELTRIPFLIEKPETPRQRRKVDMRTLSRPLSD